MVLRVLMNYTLLYITNLMHLYIVLLRYSMDVWDLRCSVGPSGLN